MAITDAVLNELLKDYQKPEDLLGQDGPLKQLQKRLLEKAMGAELTVHLGYEQARRSWRQQRQFPQRHEPQDAGWRVWEAGSGDAARSQRDL